MEKLLKYFIKFFATGFFVGYIPIAPGTFGTILAAGIWWILPKPVFYIVFIFLLLVSVFVCGEAENIFGIVDDKRIVIDEIIGYFIAVLFLPKTYFVLLSTVILFRFFDIVKPFFIKSVQKYKGSAGILADDILSGIITNLIVIITIKIFSI
ncbi:MAG: phosphatidylglycerophosphatase A [Elusimicrobia bacterium]|nr:phosphatidylglycerophosphatase A [Elusimicrobiota bacterium]